MNFFTKLTEALSSRQSLFVTGLEPNGNTQELGIQQYRQLLIHYEPIKVMVQIRH